MTQYEAIFQRCSTRRFQMKPIAAKTMEQLNHYVQEVNALYPDALYRIAVVEALNGEKPAIKGKFMVESPYYLVFFAKEHPGAAKNAGYIMEQIVLYLTAKGIGTCFLGETMAPSPVESYRCMLTLAFGMSAAPMYASRAKRRPLADLVHYRDEATVQIRRILEAARMAPSAYNRQPWRFVAYSNRIHIFMKKGGLPLPGRHRLYEISMGAMMVHMVLAAEEQWLDWRFCGLGNEKQELKGYEYTATLVFSDIVLGSSSYTDGEQPGADARDGG